MTSLVAGPGPQVGGGVTSERAGRKGRGTGAYDLGQAPTVGPLHPCLWPTTLTLWARVRVRERSLLVGIFQVEFAFTCTESSKRPVTSLVVANNGRAFSEGDFVRVARIGTDIAPPPLSHTTTCPHDNHDDYHHHHFVYCPLSKALGRSGADATHTYLFFCFSKNPL